MTVDINIKVVRAAKDRVCCLIPHSDLAIQGSPEPTRLHYRIFIGRYLKLMTPGHSSVISQLSGVARPEWALGQETRGAPYIVVGHLGMVENNSMRFMKNFFWIVDAHDPEAF